MATLGYARVSTHDQDPQLQLDALEKAGCQRTWIDRASGAKAARPELEALLSYAREGDVITVWKLDRLGRSLAHLLATAERLEKEGVQLRSITEAIDTTTPSGRLVFHTLGAVAAFERDLIRERTRAGLAAARAAGRIGGRPSITEDQKRSILDLAAAGRPRTEIARVLGVARSTVYRVIEGAAA